MEAERTLLRRPLPTQQKLISKVASKPPPKQTQQVIEDQEQQNYNSSIQTNYFPRRSLRRAKRQCPIHEDIQRSENDRGLPYSALPEFQTTFETGVSPRVYYYGGSCPLCLGYVTEPCDKLNILDLNINHILPEIYKKKPWRQALSEEQPKRERKDIFEQTSEPRNSQKLKTHKTKAFEKVPSPIQETEEKVVNQEEVTKFEKLYREVAKMYPKQIDQFLMGKVQQWYTHTKAVVVDNDSLVSLNPDGSISEMSRESSSVMQEPATKQTKLNLKARFLDNLPGLPAGVFPSLVWINLSFNNFNEIPAQIVKLGINVDYLTLRTNPLSQLPHNLNMLSNLTCLNLSYCRLEHLNQSLFEVKKLKVLDIAHNEIAHISPSISKLTNLRELYCEGNMLRIFPSSFIQLNLAKFGCGGNFLSNLFWEESVPAIPQTLRELSKACLLENDMFHCLPENERKTCLCEMCGGCSVGEGVPVLKPVNELFGVRNLPLLFRVCSQRCRNQLIQTTQY